MNLFKKKGEEEVVEAYTCVECGHLFEKGGEKRRVDTDSTSFNTLYTFETEEEIEERKKKSIKYEWYCSLHIPAWERRVYSTYYKEFEVNEDGTIKTKSISEQVADQFALPKPKIEVSNLVKKALKYGKNEKICNIKHCSLAHKTKWKLCPKHRRKSRNWARNNL